MKKNQVNTSLPSLSTSKKTEANILQLILAGSYNQVKKFWEFMNHTSNYRWTRDFRFLFDKKDQQEDLHLTMQLEEIPSHLSTLHRKERMIQMETRDGKQITFSLLHVQVVEMLDGRLYIQGKSYDIFANPNDDREEVDCIVVDTKGEGEK